MLTSQRNNFNMVYHCILPCQFFLYLTCSGEAVIRNNWNQKLWYTFCIEFEDMKHPKHEFDIIRVFRYAFVTE